MKVKKTTEIEITLNDIEKILKIQGTIEETQKVFQIRHLPGNKDGVVVIIVDTIYFDLGAKQSKQQNTNQNPESTQQNIATIDSEELNTILDAPIKGSLNLRTYNCLRPAGVTTLREIIKFKEKDLLKFRNFGKKALNEVKNLVYKHGLEFTKED